MAVPAVLVLAWVVSNWSDAPPRPVPAALQVAAPRLHDERNLFWPLAGLFAQADRDPGAAGLAAWQGQQAWGALTPAQRAEPARQDALRQADAAAMGQRLPPVASGALECSHAETRADGCISAWLASPQTVAALASERVRHGVVGARCDALVSGDAPAVQGAAAAGAGLPARAFEERLAPQRSSAEVLALHASGAASCAAWWHRGAVLAWQQGQPAQAVAALQRSARFDALLMAGSSSLIGHRVAVRLAQRTQATVLALGLRDPALRPALAQLLHGEPDLAAAVRRWIAHEAAYGRNNLAEMEQHCQGPAELPPDVQAGAVWRGVHQVTQASCRLSLGYHPERTRQAADAMWLARQKALDAGLAPALQRMQAEDAVAAQRSMWAGWHWRNTVGQMLLDVGASTWTDYIAASADLGLHREAAALGLAAAALPAAERAAWAQRQALSPLAQGRITWDAEGRGLTLQPWATVPASTLASSPANPTATASAPWRITWPAGVP